MITSAANRYQLSSPIPLQMIIITHDLKYQFHHVTLLFLPLVPHSDIAGSDRKVRYPVRTLDLQQPQQRQHSVFLPTSHRTDDC